MTHKTDLLQWAVNTMRKMHECEADEREVAACIAQCEDAIAAPAAEPQLLDDASLRAQIGGIGNEVHNLSCELDNARLGNIAGRLWKLAQQASSEPAAEPPEMAEIERALSEVIAASFDQEWETERVARKQLISLIRRGLDARPAVPDGFRLVPQQFVYHVLALEHNWTKLVPIPPEFCCGPDAEYWFKEAYRRCGKDLTNAKEMLAAAPSPGDVK